MTLSRKTITLALLGVILWTSEAQALMVLTVSGGWAPAIGADDLAVGAGSDLVSSRESAVDEVALTVSSTSGAAWRVDVKRDIGSWNNNLSLSAKRTGDGLGGGSISGGLSYVLIDTGVDNQLFSGAGDLGNIPVQMKLDGVSLQVPPDSYSTTITYTLVEIE